MNIGTRPMNNKLLVMIVLASLLAGCGGKDQSAAKSDEQSAAAADEHGHEEGEGKAGAHVELTAEQVKAAGVELIEAGPAQIRETLSLYGVVAPNAERVREVVARFPGVIRDVSPKIGDPVRQGDTL